MESLDRVKKYNPVEIILMDRKYFLGNFPEFNKKYTKRRDYCLVAIVDDNNGKTQAININKSEDQKKLEKWFRENHDHADAYIFYTILTEKSKKPKAISRKRFQNLYNDNYGSFKLR